MTSCTADAPVAVTTGHPTAFGCTMTRTVLAPSDAMAAKSASVRECEYLVHMADHPASAG